MILLPRDYSAPAPVNVNSVGTRWFTYLVFSSSLVVYYLLPVWAGIFTETFNFSNKQVGFLLSADMSANTLAAFSARYWIHRCYWKRLFPITVFVTMLPNLLCAMADSFWMFLTLRYLAGFGAGLMVAFIYATIAASDNPDREFAYAMSLQVLLGAVFLKSAAYLWTNWGAGIIFVLCGLVVMAPLLCFQAIPDSNPLSQRPADRNGDTGAGKIDRTALVGLLAVGLFFASMNAVWSFMERIGNAEGFDTDFIALALSVSLVFSFSGALAPVWLAGRVKRIAAILTGYVVLLVSIFVIGHHPAAVAYLSALCIYNFFYSFVIPFQNGWIAGFDRTGRTVVLLPFVQGIGIATGPLIAGFVIDGNNYTSVSYVSVILLLSSSVLFFLMNVKPGNKGPGLIR